MAAPSGISAQIGFGEEVTVGVPVVPTVFLPLVSEGLTLEKERLESEAIIAGKRVLTSDQWNGGPNTVGGDVAFELYNRGLGKLFKHMFGTSGTVGSGPYTHTFSPGPLTGLGLSCQVGRPAIDGTVHPFLYAGLKVASWELACSAGEIATLGLTFVGISEAAGSRVVADGVTATSTALTSATAVFTAADVGKLVTGTGVAAGSRIASVTSATAVVLSAATTATATGVSITIGSPLATATLPASIKPLKFNHGAVTIGGSAVNVKAATLAGDNGLADDRRFLGTQDAAEALEQDLRTYDGSLELEFTSLALYNAFVNGTEAAVVLSFTSGADSVTITTNVRYDGETPVVGGREILTQNLPIKCVGSSTDASAITAVLVNGDSSV